MDPKKPKDPYLYLGTWLERCRQASDVAPDVQKMYEIQQWKRQTLEQRPTEADSISIARIDQWDVALYDRLEASLPMLPVIDRTLVTEASSTATATCVDRH